MVLVLLRRLKVLKLLGLIGIFITFGLIGIYKTNTLKQRISLLKDYYKMVLVLKTQINYFKDPLPDIFNNIAKNNDSKAFDLLDEIRHNIDEKGDNLAILWIIKVEEIYKRTPITKEDIDVISYLGNFIGQTDYLNQIQHFEYIERQLNLQINEAIDNYNQKGPMYNKLGFFIGAIIAILLI